MKRLLLIPIVTFLLLCSFPNLAYAPIIPHEYTLDIPCYAPTKITFNYAYTHNHTIYDISTFGSSLYEYSGGPTHMEFIAKDVDDYTFTLELTYNAPTNQTILVGVWSGTLPMMGLNFESIYEKIIVHVHLRVQEQPTYPSEEDVAKQVVLQVHKDLQEYYASINELVKNQNIAIYTVTGIAAACVAAIIVVAVVNVLELRRFRESRG